MDCSLDMLRRNNHFVISTTIHMYVCLEEYIYVPFIHNKSPGTTAWKWIEIDCSECQKQNTTRFEINLIVADHFVFLSLFICNCVRHKTDGKCVNIAWVERIELWFGSMCNGELSISRFSIICWLWWLRWWWILASEFQLGGSTLVFIRCPYLQLKLAF
jgi:hypothetical protein